MIYLTRGLPGCGKTTFAMQWLEEYPDLRVRANRDDLRFAMYGKYWGLSYEQENSITAAQKAIVIDAVKNGKDVILDDTNLKAANVKGWLKLADSLNTSVDFVDFFDVTPEECIIRDAQRTRQVGADVIMNMAKRYGLLGGKKLKIPVLDPETVNDTALYEGTPGKNKTVLVDLDGTVAHSGGRRGFYDWDKVGEDDPIEVIISLVQSLWASAYDLVFVSGRDEVCYPQSHAWIKKHIFDSIKQEWYNPTLFMRPLGDQRKDSIVKLEIFDKYIRDNYDVKFCLDDRQQVVEAYRSIGLIVLQVAPGDF